MKKSYILAALLLGTIAGATNVETVDKSFLGDNLSADLRTMYFKRSFDNATPDSKSTTQSVIVKYESNDFHGISAGAAYFGSYRIGGWFNQAEGATTSTLDRDGKNLGFVGEAYLQYKHEVGSIKLGRQRLNTPLINDHDLRQLPSTYEAAVATLNIIPNTKVEVGHVSRYTGFTSKEDKFLDFNTKWGSKGLAYIYIKNNSIENLTLSGQYVKALNTKDEAGLNIAVKDYRYADLIYKINVGTNTYFKAQYGGNDYQTTKDSNMYGSKIGTTVSIVDVAVLYNKIEGGNFTAVEAGPMYSDWQQGYGNYEASEAYGGQLIVKPITDLYIKLGYVDVHAREASTVDDFAESNIDVGYTINKHNKVRVRYSQKDQTSTSTREDRNDLRVLYYLNF